MLVIYLSAVYPSDFKKRISTTVLFLGIVMNSIDFHSLVWQSSHS